MTNREIAEIMAFFWVMGLFGYIIRVVMCELKYDAN
jgi:preprotein translocase subunit Sss1